MKPARGSLALDFGMRVLGDRRVGAIVGLGAALWLAAVGTAARSSALKEAAAAERYWPQWRGPLGTGEAPHAHPPVEWSESKNVRWKDLGRMQTRNSFGEGSSPAIHDGTLIVNWDHEGSDFIAAFDAKTGREKWRRERDEPTTWATPHVVVHAGRAQAVVGGTNRLLSYDLATGEIVWEAPGLTLNVIPSPVSANGVVYAMSGFRGNVLRAVRLADAQGVIAGPPGLPWSYDRDTPYVPSPLLYNGRLYFLKSNNGIISCFDAQSGKKLYGPERLESVPNVYASPVGAAGRIYVFGREGGAAVLADGSELKVLAQNKLEDGFDASPAIVGNEMYVRGKKYLYRISAE